MSPVAGDPSLATATMTTTKSPGPAKMIEILQHDTSCVVGRHRYIPPVNPGSSRLLKAGTIHAEGHRPLLSDIIIEEDVSITLRDGTCIYADVFRPANVAYKTPAILAAGPFGKNGGPNKYNFDKLPWRFGCPRIATSGLEKFEGPDPGYWCYHGYAIVHTDCRGSWKSEGDIILSSDEEGRDNYDIIENIAARVWCNGRVTMCGNSYLAITQWFAGAEQPPHLACLAPWEGASSLYDDLIRRGGVPNPGFTSGLLKGDIGSFNNSKCIDIAAMCYKYPLMNDYWRSLKARSQDIQCPMYIVASWTNHLHTRGTFRAWEECGSREKWLRIHNTHEWPDQYDPQNVEDLRRFYDFYLKDMNNGWQFTPRIRLSVLNPGGVDVVNRPEQDFPLQRQRPFKLYLNPGSNILSRRSASGPLTFSYEAKNGDIQFRWPLPTVSPMEFTGYSRLRLWAEARGSNDMDVFVTLKKIQTRTNQILESLTVDVGRLQADPDAARHELLAKHSADSSFCSGYFVTGPLGCLRASHRELDENRSTAFCPSYTHREEQLLEPGQIVPLDIAIWPYGMIINPGEELLMTISGYHPSPHCRPTDPKPELRNEGQHVFYVGGQYDSYLLLPWIPGDEQTQDNESRV